VCKRDPSESGRDACVGGLTQFSKTGGSLVNTPWQEKLVGKNDLSIAIEGNEQIRG